VVDDLAALERYVMNAYESVGYDTTMEYDRHFVFDRVRVHRLLVAIIFF
jgi:hypothetical protein